MDITNIPNIKDTNNIKIEITPTNSELIIRSFDVEKESKLSD